MHKFINPNNHSTTLFDTKKFPSVQLSASGVKQHISGQSLHPTYLCILFRPPL